MQLAKPSLKLALLAALVAHGAFAVAQVAAPVPAGAAPGPVVGAPPVGAYPAVAQGGASPATTTAGAVKAVAIGKGDEVPAGTLKELEGLQRDAYLAELRSKLRTLNAADAKSAPAASYGAAPVPGQQPIVPGSMPVRFSPPVPPAFQPAQPYGAYPYPVMSAQGGPAMDPVVSALLVSVIVSGGRPRADVMDGGIIKTVKEGDRLGEWTVAAINPTGVRVETVKVIPAPVRAAKPLKSGRHAPAVEAPAPETRTITAMLKPYIPPAPVPANAAGVGGIQAAVVPPLPAQIKYPDSSSIGAATPMTPR